MNRIPFCLCVWVVGEGEVGVRMMLARMMLVRMAGVGDVGEDDGGGRYQGWRG